MPFLVVGVDSCHLNSPVFSTQGKQMWDQTQRMAGGEKVCMAVYEEKCFCVLTFESKGLFCTSALCLERGCIFLANPVGGKHIMAVLKHLCVQLTTAQAETGSLLISAAALGIYFSLDEGKVWSQTPDQVPEFVPCKSKLFSKIMARYSFPDSWRSRRCS